MSDAERFLAERVPQASFRTLLAARGVKKTFRMGETELEVLHGVDLELRRGERLALMGPSGAGKSTLLHTLGLLDPPTAGTVIIEGASAWELSTAERARLRNQRIGFVFQFYHLIPELTALENVVLPAMIADGYRAKAKEHVARGRETLAGFGLEKRLSHRPAQLSGGERQRVALARALHHDPPILIADEPTGNLDRATGERVLDLLFDEQERRSLSLLLVTHDERLAARCGRVLHMEDGRIRRDSSGA
jgi:predicted ABC-type transport system involved in lysophospholipase L1 biosynthesis ATPase subunit